MNSQTLVRKWDGLDGLASRAEVAHIQCRGNRNPSATGMVAKGRAGAVFMIQSFQEKSCVSTCVSLASKRKTSKQTMAFSQEEGGGVLSPSKTQH